MEAPYNSYFFLEGNVTATSRTTTLHARSVRIVDEETVLHTLANVSFNNFRNSVIRQSDELQEVEPYDRTKAEILDTIGRSRLAEARERRRAQKASLKKE